MTECPLTDENGLEFGAIDSGNGIFFVKYGDGDIDYIKTLVQLPQQSATLFPSTKGATMNSVLRATAAVTLAVASQGVVASQAFAGTDGYIDGYVVSIVESGSWNAPDFITVYGPKGKEQITVTCAPFNWSSYGANTESFVNSIASSWCF